ncbi:MAG: hypothetical protein ONB05_08635, partial [candidate division KSB1 bacterium]|nr:hypothetical protein [candidate division KSB1 bacterium]
LLVYPWISLRALSNELDFPKWKKFASRLKNLTKLCFKPTRKTAHRRGSKKFLTRSCRNQKSK